MTTPRNYQTEAIIIRKTKLGEADTILTLYTPHLGKIQGFAKSLRKTKSKMAGHLELITHSQVALARGRNIDTITGGQTITGFLPLKSDLDLSSQALYIIELVNQFTAEHIENYPLFKLLLETLEHLSAANNKELTLRYFELHLLENVGYRPQLQNCVHCRTPLKPVVNYFSPAAGGIICPDCAYGQFAHYPITVNALKVLRLLQSSSLDTVERLRIDPELSRELEMILRNYLRYLLEREVKSAAWLDTLKGDSGK
jgi:DNA repair protein RecO (recombination protein O)